MSYKPSFVSGDWKAVCQICGRIFKGSQLMKRWDGIWTCSEDFDPKHPQLSVRGVRDDQRPPFVVPEGVNQFDNSSLFAVSEDGLNTDFAISSEWVFPHETQVYFAISE